LLDGLNLVNPEAERYKLSTNKTLESHESYTMSMSGKSFEPVDALRRIGDAELVRYRCFRVLPDNKYWVQGADSFRLPLTEEQNREITEQSLNVLGSVPFVVGDESREDFGQMCDTLDEAIIAFEAHCVRTASGSDPV
jgi:hypothetical protein